MRAGEDTPSSLPPAPSSATERVWWALRLAPRMPFVWFMRAYRRLISPLYGEVCRYYPSCSKYALDAFEVKGAVRGTLLTVWRLLRCNPFSPGGVDHVPGSLMDRRSAELRSRGIIGDPSAEPLHRPTTRRTP
ncbi:membrane protein insertion efficiency factor YidD [Brevibacterium samyangense]|uniref:membrane protein insertion efficiency factor YidD n=1 Tax=Brevibacterium samyangense TaxID=366888 RepID=UPI003CD0AFC5